MSDTRINNLRMPRRIRRRLMKVSPQARIAYVIGLLVCDENGRISKMAFDVASRDPVTVATAHRLAREWRLL
jgi:hypothetical protein